MILMSSPTHYKLSKQKGQGKENSEWLSDILQVKPKTSLFEPKMSSSFVAVINILYLCLCHFINSEPKRNLHSSCLDLNDGQHYLQLLTNDELSLLSRSDKELLTAPIVHVRCDSGNTIIDPSFDSGWSSYFTSFHQYTVKSAGPDLDDHSSWREWFLINELLDVQYSISPDCKKCVDDTDYMDKVYYMSGDIFSCYWPLKQLESMNHKCTADENGYSECSKCHSLVDGKTYYAPNCGSMIFNADVPIYDDHLHCMESPSPNKIPSIGMNGEFCVCYKPLGGSTDLKAANWGNHYAIDSWDDNGKDVKFDTDKEYELRQDEKSKKENDEEEPVDIQLYQSDFEHGTYRIRQPGTYTLMENIKFCLYLCVHPLHPSTA